MLKDTTTLGRIGEFAVFADLTKQGFEVFIGFGSLSCDCIALFNGQMFRIEIKTKSKRDNYDNCIFNTKRGKYDISALYHIKDKTIRYKPNLEGLKCL